MTWFALFLDWTSNACQELRMTVTSDFKCWKVIKLSGKFTKWYKLFCKKFMLTIWTKFFKQLFYGDCVLNLYCYNVAISPFPQVLAWNNRDSVHTFAPLQFNSLERLSFPFVTWLVEYFFFCFPFIAHEVLAVWTYVFFLGKATKAPNARR